jgi:hypothetical protein
LRTICTKINSSPQRRASFIKHLANRYKGKASGKHADLSLLSLFIDVSTWWNSTYHMLVRALLLQEAIDDWIHEELKFRDILRLTQEEWDLVRDVLKILEVRTSASVLSAMSDLA